MSRRSATARTGGSGELVVDNRRVPCAIGLIQAQRRMAELAPGGSMVVISRDQFAPMELRLWAERDGHQVVAVERAGWWPGRVHRVAIRKHAVAGAACSTAPRPRGPAEADTRVPPVTPRKGGKSS